ncbi:MAG: hypothetical protein L6408_03050, partial [Nanoarchaeota archaeon]|nr:hypothetical protein [Nanoarchaeota archaeon]
EIEGTIIDFETIGDFNKQFSDSRRFKDIKPVIFGILYKNKLEIHYITEQHKDVKLLDVMKNKLKELPRPFYAFNCNFERGILFHQLGIDMPFDGELQQARFETKYSARSNLNISNYDDPFNDDGLLCKEAWLKGNHQQAVQHNRSCLLKERDILIKRSFNRPRDLELVN